jgi:MFS family permease
VTGRTPLAVLTRDGRLLFATRIARLFGYGFLSVVLVLYLVEIGFGAFEVGLLLTLTLLGDAAISLWLTTHADRLGRRRVLLAGAGLMVLAGIAFLLSRDLWVLVLTATIGVISPSGNEVGPFLAVEQAALSQTVADRQRTRVFAWYNLVGSFSTASGALAAGLLGGALQAAGSSPLESYRAIIVGYALIGVLLAALFATLSPAIEAPIRTDVSVATRLGLHRSQGVVARLAALFALDAFAGGFVIQSIVSFWFATRFGLSIGALGALFFAANVVPFMPTAPLAVALLLARFSISQMDVSTRQSYTMAVVDPDERSAAAGVTGIARSVGAAVSPSIAAPLMAGVGLGGLPFVIAGSLKIVYDRLLLQELPVASAAGGDGGGGPGHAARTGGAVGAGRRSRG